MSISETTLAGNHGTTSAGSTPPGISAARASQEICNIAEQIKAHVTKAAQKGDSFDEAERAAWNSVLQIGFQAMQLFVALQGQGDLGEQVQPENGKPLIRSEKPASTTVRSVFGEHSFEQFTYSAGKRKKIELRPISARMSLPQSRWSHLLQEFSQVFCVEQAYGQAAANLELVLKSRF